MTIEVQTSYRQGILGPVICDDKDYFADKGINCSGLKTIKQKSAYHYHMYARANTDSDSEALRIGTLIHALVLETPQIESFAFYDGASFNSKAAKEFVEKNKGTRCFLERELEKAKRIYKNAYEQNDLIELVKNTDYQEIACFVHRQGYRSKCKADALVLPKDDGTDGIIWDVKTTGDFFEFAKSARKYGYHMGDYWYRQIFQQAFGRRFEYRLLVIEKNYPFTVVEYEFSERVLKQGKQWTEEAFAKYCVGKDTCVWRKPDTKILLDWGY